MTTWTGESACIRGCTFTDPDGVVWAKDAKWGLLCGSCFWRVRWRLAEAPKIVVALRSTMDPRRAGAVESRVSGSRERSLPFFESQAPDADDLFGVLVDWATSHAEVLGGRAATSLPGAAWRMFGTGENSRGLGSGVSPKAAGEAVAEVVGWLVRWGEQIASLPAVTAYHDDVVAQVGRYRVRAGLVAPRARRAAPHGCPVCLAGVVEVSVPDVGPVLVRCSECREVFDAGDALAEISEAVAA